MPDQLPQPPEPHGTAPERRFLTIIDRALPWHFVDDGGFVGRMLVQQFGVLDLLRVSTLPEPWSVLRGRQPSQHAAELIRIAMAADAARRNRWQYLPLGWVQRGRNLVEEARTCPSNALWIEMRSAGFRRLGRRFVEASKDGMPPDMAEDLERQWREYREHEIHIGHRTAEAVDAGAFHASFAEALDARRPDAFILLGWLALWSAPPKGNPYTVPGLAFMPSRLTAQLLKRLGMAVNESTIRRIIAAHQLDRGPFAVAKVAKKAPERWIFERTPFPPMPFSDWELWLPPQNPAATSA